MLVYIGKITLACMSLEWTASVYVTSKMFKLDKVFPCFEELNQEVRENIFDFVSELYFLKSELFLKCQ